MAEILKDMPFAEYLAHCSYGSSDLRTFRVGPPALVPWSRKNRDDATPATRVGSAAHCAILTPTLFESVYAIKPEGMTFASKEGKAWKEAHEQFDILTFGEWEAVRQIHAAFTGKLPAFEALHSAIAREASVFWNCRKTGLPSKGRPDWFSRDIVYDLKVSIEAQKDADSMAYRAYRCGWLQQLAHNRAGLIEAGVDIKAGRLVVIAPSPPQEHRVWLLEVCENDLDFLELDNINTRLGMAECHRTGHWPGTPNQWRVIELPASAAFTESDLEGATEVLTS